MNISEQLGALKAGAKQRAIYTNLFRFCTEVLGYDALSAEFHGPMLAEWDRIDLAASRGKLVLDTQDLWPRDHIKTWCMRARVIRAYILNPAATVTWWHAVEEMAQESAVAIGKMIQTNKDLRRLFPATGCLPSPQAKRFVQASGFSLNSNRIGDAPSMRAWGAGSEATGGHSDIGVLDDIVGFNDVADNQMPAKRKWFQATVCNVIKSKGGNKWAIGTRWDRDDPYAMWLKSAHWQSRVRACLETDGVPDPKGKPVYLTMAQIRKKRDELGPVQFALQMMNDPSHSEERPWKPEACEHYTTLDEAKGPGLTVCIMDPAATNVGGDDYFQERRRGDGSKDRWAIQIWKIRKNGQRQELIWIDGKSSADWSMDEGMTVACDMMRHRGAVKVMIEDTDPFHYQVAFKRVARAQGIRYTTPITPTSRLSGKNARWGAFCSRAEMHEVLICKDTVPDPQIERFIDQARNWIPRGKQNGLPFDDDADCASYVCDPALAAYAPRPDLPGDETGSGWNPFTDHIKVATPQHGGRYIRY